MQRLSSMTVYSTSISTVRPLVVSSVQHPLAMHAAFVWKCINGLAPADIQELCVPVESVCGRVHTLMISSSSRRRCQSTSTINQPAPLDRSAVRSVGGPSLSGIRRPTVWSSLPLELREPTVSNGIFQRTLKTILFARYEWLHRAQLRCFA